MINIGQQRYPELFSTSMATAAAAARVFGTMGTIGSDKCSSRDFVLLLTL